jgi:rhamnogalacturonyl hydrolase YesR
MKKYIYNSGNKSQKLLILIYIFFSASFYPLSGGEPIILSSDLKSYIEKIEYDLLGVSKGVNEITVIDKNIIHVRIFFILDKQIQQDDWQVVVTPAFNPEYHWAPHLTPTDSHVIEQHVFRSPALIASDRNSMLMLIPDLDIMKRGTPVRWYMDLDAPGNRLVIGMSNSRVDNHILFTREPGAIYPKGEVEFGFYIIHSDDENALNNPFRLALNFLWTNWGHDLYQSGNPVDGDLENYVEHTYNWAFNSWSESVWQEFELNGRNVGSPVFIVNVTQSPNYPGEINEREFRSVWNQAWFSSLRSASGLYRYARRTGKKELMEKALLTKELALSFPKKEGFFYGLIRTEMHQKEIGGETFYRSKGWDTHYWGNSNRNPYTWNPEESPFHILDMSWTALLMLRWYEDLEKDERLLEYAKDYAESLLTIQSKEGFFPGWLNLNTLQPMSHLNSSPETSMSVTFLLKLYELTEEKRYCDAALKAMDIIIEEIIPTGRWEDFETYWSCSRYGSDNLIGSKISRNNMYKQNNLSMFWTAEALLKSYKVTGVEKYLKYGQRTLDEMLMTQASWQPPYMFVNVLGGFGVLNADAEWNDSRQSLFAELIIQYGKLLNKPEYIERGYAALKASFVMMYCPENPQTMKQWEKVYPFFGREDYGFMMENYGHGGRTGPDGEGMGEFTIYDWGNGAAAEAYNRILDKFGNFNLE